MSASAARRIASYLAAVSPARQKSRERPGFVYRQRSGPLWRSTFGAPLPVSSIPKIMRKTKMTM
jgi:hypothetical protein